MLNSERDEIIKNNYYLNQRNNVKKKNKFRKDSTIIFIVAVVLAIPFLSFLYAISPYSKTYKIVCEGNVYLKDEDIIKEANLSKYFLLTFPTKNEKKLKQNPFFEDVDIKMLNGNIVSINVKEVKQIGYLFEDNESKLLLINDVRIPLSASNMYLIDKIPLIEGYTKEELLKIEKDFRDVDYKVINEISEIHKYPVSYDNEQMEIVMRDGNFCFLSSSSLKLLENYYVVSSGIDSSKGHACVYLDDLTNSAYISTCPWQIEKNDTKDS